MQTLYQIPLYVSDVNYEMYLLELEQLEKRKKEYENYHTSEPQEQSVYFTHELVD